MLRKTTAWVITLLFMSCQAMPFTAAPKQADVKTFQNASASCLAPKLSGLDQNQPPEQRAKLLVEEFSAENADFDLPPVTKSFLENMLVKYFKMISADSGSSTGLSFALNKDIEDSASYGNNDFWAAAQLTNEQREKYVGAFQNEDLPEAAAGELDNVRFISIDMNGGLGSSLKREKYLEEMNKIFGNTGEVQIGAKGTDLYFRIKLDNGENLYVSVTETKVIRLINKAQEGAYGEVSIAQLVNDESQESIAAVYNRPYLADVLANVEKGMSLENAKANARTYKQAISDIANVELADDIFQNKIPTIDIAEGALTTQRIAPGGHGQPGAEIMLQLADKTHSDGNTYDANGKTVVSAILNGDGVNNTVAEKMIKWAADKNQPRPVIMIQTEKTINDVKGGQVGVTTSNGTLVPTIMEVAQAEAAGEEDTFKKMGLELGITKQLFNTNSAVLNESVLIPILDKLKTTLDAIEPGLFEQVVTPDLILNKKAQDGKDFYQLEGALGSTLLSLNAFVMADPRLDEFRTWLKDTYNLDRLVYFVNTSEAERTDFFTPTKVAMDFWVQSVFFKLDHTKGEIINERADGTQPQISSNLAKGIGYYKDLQSVIDAFGLDADIADLEFFNIELGDKQSKPVHLPNAKLSGTVEIFSHYKGDEAFFDLTKAPGMATFTKNGCLELNNVKVFIAPNGETKVVEGKLTPTVKADLDLWVFDNSGAQFEMPGVTRSFLRNMLVKLYSGAAGSSLSFALNKSITADPATFAGNEFWAAAMLDNDQREQYVGAFQHEELPATDTQRLQNVRFASIDMNGGLGSSLKREKYLEEMNKQLGVEGDVQIGAKGTDLYFKINIDADNTVWVSVSEMKIINQIQNALNKVYGEVTVLQLVNDESQESIAAVYDRPYLADVISNIKAGQNMQDAKANARTYREVLAEIGNINQGTDVFQAKLPTIDENGNLTVERIAPGGHGQPGTELLNIFANQNHSDGTAFDPNAKTVVSAIYNGDGINNTVDARMVSWVADPNTPRPIIMIQTTKTINDVKGGQIGVTPEVKDGKTTLVPTIMELAQAEATGETETFKQMGLTIGQTEQLFNTNSVLINESVLIPILNKLKTDLDAVEPGLFEQIITPDLIKNKKSQDGKSFIQIEGALGSTMLTLNAFVMSDPRLEGFRNWLQANYGLDRLLFFINTSETERTDFFTPTKVAMDFWLQSTFFDIDHENGRIINTRPDGTMPQIDSDLAKGISYYTDLQNVVDAFGLDAQVKDLEFLSVKLGTRDAAPVKLANAKLSGRVLITSNCRINDDGGIFDLNTAPEMQQFMVDGTLTLNNVIVIIDEDGNVSVTSTDEMIEAAA